MESLQLENSQDFAAVVNIRSFGPRANDEDLDPLHGGCPLLLRRRRTGQTQRIKFTARQVYVTSKEYSIHIAV